VTTMSATNDPPPPDDDRQAMVAMMPFAQGLGIALQAATPDEVTGTVTWRPELCTTAGLLHGGVVMATADSLRSWKDDPEGVLRTSIDAYLSLVEADNHLYRFLVQQEARAGNRTTSEFVRRVSAQVADVLRGVWTMSGLDTANADLWAHAIVGMVHAAGDWWADGQAMSRSDVVAALTTLAGSGLDGAR